MTDNLSLNIEKALQLLRPDGALSRMLHGFESRESQQQMMRTIIEAYNENQIGLIEAGTGTGKSLAYIIPALLWASQHKERTLISTHTITLQEQLINKDIPLVTKALNIDVKAVLIKGMGNYVCQRKLEETRMERLLLSPEESTEFEKISLWESKTAEGSRSELSFIPSPSLWGKISAESDTCNHQECPYYQSCHFFKARHQAQDAQILVVNHHLLFADLAFRAENNNYQNPGILPAYTRIILDEAHHIEDIATEYFAKKISHSSLMRTMARLASDKHGKLSNLRQLLHKSIPSSPSPEIHSLLGRLNIDLPGIRNDILQQTFDLFQLYFEFSKTIQLNKITRTSEESGQPGRSDHKMRLLPSHKMHPMWKERILPSTQRLFEALRRYVQSIVQLEKDSKAVALENFEEKTRTVRYEIIAFANRLNEASGILENFISEPTQDSPKTVRWIENQTTHSIPNTQLVDAELDVAERLVNFLFNKFSTIILCSATLTTNQEFEFIKRRLGLTPKFLTERLREKVYQSPFNYQQQALFAIPTDVPSPLHPDFIKIASERIWDAIQASRGGAFVLFTSYSMLKTCYECLQDRLKTYRYTPIKQGDDNRQSLLNKFKTSNKAVLFGTDSFWEGVDVVGKALRCVIIVKLPFRVPSEPIIQARTEAILARGGNPFTEYSLPHAIVKFKQGFGRLIRNQDDQGCVVCLDIRLLDKNYGALFLNSLPACRQLFVNSSQLHHQMVSFYKNKC